MTTYGTIPTEPPDSSNFEFVVSRAKERIRSGIGTRRPWKEMVSVYTITLPSSFAESLSRIRTNATYFRSNYAIIVLFVLFLSLLWKPISLIVFVVTMTAWLFFYFLRNEPLVIFNRMIDDRMILIGLSVVTIVLLFLTHATVNIVVGLLVGFVLVLVHGGLRRTDGLLLDEEEGVGSGVGWRSGGGGGGGGGARMHLKETASSSFSSPS